MIHRPKKLTLFFLLLVALAGVSATAVTRGRGTRAADPRVSIMQGRAAAAAWISAGQREHVDAQTTIVLGYLERHRLGLGSPFRLIDYALQDPRLPDTTRERLGWALLARTLDGDGYQIDAASLDRAGAGGIASLPGAGERHLKLITNEIEHARDPRTAELAIRLAYELAATEGSLPLHAPRYADNAAALIRDRELAKADASDLLQAARAQRVDALQLMQRWRAERKLQVEQPALATLPQEGEREALVGSLRIAASLREIGQDAKTLLSAHPSSADANPALLTPAVAQALLMHADSLNMPPLAPLVVGARGYDHELVAQPWLSARERAHRKALESAGSEERFAARFALVQRVNAYDVVPSLVAMWSAVGMRSMAQEAVWYPGYPAPSAGDLSLRYGLSSVSFAPSVPLQWRPYYRRMIDNALSDMQLVLPALNVRGMSIRFQEVGSDAGTLALHDPKQRRLLLPPSTAAGTLAHEIAHDIDWQLAVKRYSVRGDYASDRAVSHGSSNGDRLALRMQDLAVGSTVPASATSQLAVHARRPTEIFARNVDFLVTSALAERGRVDGYLSSMQDELLTGYGTVRAPELTGVAADALVKILDQIAPASAETRGWFLRNYGTGRSLRSYDLARRVFESDPTEIPRGAIGAAAPLTDEFAKIAKARDLGYQAIDAWSCKVPGGAYNTSLEEARRALVGEAAEARADGYAIRRARALMGRAAGQWVAGQLFGAPWHVDGVTPEMETYLSDLVKGAQSIPGNASIARQEGFKLSAPPAHCGSGALTKL